MVTYITQSPPTPKNGIFWLFSALTYLLNSIFVKFFLSMLKSEAIRSNN